VVGKTSAIFTVLAQSIFPQLRPDHYVGQQSPTMEEAGGQIATSSLHSSANEIAIHELGHSFARLKDEYYAG
jgi:hypothetical protein